MEKEEKEEELFIPKTKHKGLKILLGIFLIAGLIVGGYFLYQYKFNNPNTIVNNLLEDARENLKKSIADNISSNAYKVNGHVKVDTNLTKEMLESFNVDGIDIIKDLELQFDGEIDMNNSLANLNINTKYQNEKLIDLKTYYENSVFYVLLDGIYDKYLKLNEENSVSTTIPKIDIKPKEIEQLVNSIIDAMKKEVDKLDLKSEKTKITVDGKEMDAINNYVELKDNEVNEFVKNIINFLGEDKDFSDMIKRLTDQDAKTILNTLNQTIDQTPYKGTYKINFYTDRGIFNKKLISVRQDITQSGITMSLDVDKISDEEMKISVNAMGMIYSLKIKRTNSVVNVTLGINILGSYLNIDISSNYEKIKEVTKTDVSNSKAITELTEQENNEISEKLNKNEVIKKIIQKLEGTTTTIMGA